jgi:predicted lipid-binding transport protein (Tim44 family)
MQRFMTVFLALCLGLTLSLDANAKRLGGGKSFGSAPSHQATQTRQTAPTATAAAPMAGKAAAASGASRWLGPLAGLAAGGLLASMFMGDGFQGMQMLDMLIIALIAFLAFRFIAARRQQQAQPAMAGGVPYQRDMPQSTPASIFGGSSAASVKAPIKAPAWFNETSFVNAGREHFLSLQQHWDANEMDKIAEFTTPQLQAFLQKERADLGDAFQSTYIDNLDVQLDGLDDQADKTIATLTFSGIEKTSRFDQGEAFSESWRMERAQGDNQPWLIAGMRQN